MFNQFLTVIFRAKTEFKGRLRQPQVQRPADIISRSEQPERQPRRPWRTGKHAPAEAGAVPIQPLERPVAAAAALVCTLQQTERHCQTYSKERLSLIDPAHVYTLFTYLRIRTVIYSSYCYISIVEEIDEY